MNYDFNKRGVPMRIGEFSRKHNIPKSTIRYYIDLGLIAPNRLNSQYIFDEMCSKNVKIIKELKDLDFSLDEISNILSFMLLSEAEDSIYVDYFMKIYGKKKNELIEEKNEIEEKLNVIETEMERLKTFHRDDTERIGVPLSFIPYLYCPKCKSQVSVNSNNVKNNMIIEGEIKCSCGFTMEIYEGVIITDDKLKSRLDLNVDLDKFQISYINKTDREFIKLIYEATNWIVKNIDLKSLSNKIIMKNNTGTGMFIRKYCELLPKDCYYIAIDNKLDFLRYTKEVLEKKSEKPNIIFICTEFKDIPIKDNVVDIIIDKTNGSFYDINKAEFVMDTLCDKLKNKGKWLGTYLHFPEGKYPKKMEDGYFKYFDIDNLMKVFNKNYEEIDTKVYDPLTMKIGEYGSFLEKGDIVYQWTYYGKRKPRT